KKKPFDMRAAARGEKEKLFEALKTAALKYTSTTAGMNAATGLLSMMDEDGAPTPPVLHVNFTEIFSDEDGNIRTVNAATIAAPTAAPIAPAPTPAAPAILKES